jgi:poly(hydroxyalkanoate) granule-associated protein
VSGPAETAHAVLLAGLGAAATLRRTGQEVFTRLVTEGRRVERRERAHVAGRTDRLRRGLSGITGGLGRRLENGATTLLARFGVPSRRDVEELLRRLDELNAKAARLL